MIIAKETEPTVREFGNQEIKKHTLYLYVAHNRVASERAIAQIEKLWEQHFQNFYELKIIDIYDQPELAEKDRIFATPTLVKKSSFTLQKLVGDLSDIKKVALALDLS